MNHHLKEITLKATGSTDLVIKEEIQSLWSGYGSIVRILLQGGNLNSIVAKHVKIPNNKKHPRGWNTDLSHLRKVKSYQVETNWYKLFAEHCDNNCKIPRCYAIESKDNEVFMVLEDLNESGYNKRLSSVNWSQIKTCLKWLANFHATFLNSKPTNLWEIGTYWHLETRPDELEVLDDINLKKAAPQIDKILNNAKFKTLVHGDAKLANFCFTEDGTKVAAVDFQYVGGGCGMKDVAYFVGSCLYEEECESMEGEILDFYFFELCKATDRLKPDINFTDLEAEWRYLYPIAWTDFHRFLKGWSPGHWKINSYSEKLSSEVIKNIKTN